MPTLTDAYPTIARALAADSGRREASIPEGDRFSALVGFAASRSGEARASLRLQAALHDVRLLDPGDLAAADPAEVVDLLREVRLDPPAKTIRLLQRLASWYESRRAEIECVDDEPRAFPLSWRDELAAINGVGRATADAIALHVFGAPVYPVDRATYRIMYRHGWIDPTVDYEDVARLLIDAADADPAALAALERGTTEIGKRFCKPAAPACDRCPFRTVLPEDGPVPLDE